MRALREVTVTVAMVLVLFLVMRAVFPDPPIEGSACPASLREPAYGECIRAWHESHHARDVHRLNTALVVILATVLIGFVLGRSRFRDFSLAVAFSMAAGFFGAYAPLGIVAGQLGGWGVLAGSGLFVVAVLLTGERRHWPQFIAAVAVGIGLLLAVLFVSFTFLNRSS